MRSPLRRTLWESGSHANLPTDCGTRNSVIRVPITKTGRRLVGRHRRTLVSAKAPIRFRDGLRGTAKRSFYLYRPSRR